MVAIHSILKDHYKNQGSIKLRINIIPMIIKNKIINKIEISQYFPFQLITSELIHKVLRRLRIESNPGDQTKTVAFGFCFQLQLLFRSSF